MIRFLDVVLATVGIVALSPILLVATVISWIDTGSPLFRQKRIGLNGQAFVLYKFRTMHLSTKELPTHLLPLPKISGFGKFLRRSKIDELPQLLNVLMGAMSMVGPRPCLLSQTAVVDERIKRGVIGCRPGMTGLSQIWGIDMSNPVLLARTDFLTISRMSVCKYLLLCTLTLCGAGRGDRVTVSGKCAFPGENTDD